MERSSCTCWATSGWPSVNKETRSPGSVRAEGGCEVAAARSSAARALCSAALSRAEFTQACKDMGGEVSEFAGGLLDRTVGFVVERAHLQYLKCCYAAGPVATALEQAASKDGKAANQLAFKAMMDDKRRHTSYYWPEPYKETNSKLAVRLIANRIIAAGKSNPAECGGFPSSQLAEASRPP